MPDLDANGFVRLNHDADPDQAITNCRLCDDDGYRGATICDHHDHTPAARRGNGPHPPSHGLDDHMTDDKAETIAHAIADAARLGLGAAATIVDAYARHFPHAAPDCAAIAAEIRQASADFHINTERTTT
jgi:hypothetical protein